MIRLYQNIMLIKKRMENNKLYILNTVNMEIYDVDIKYIDECKFAIFDWNGNIECSYDTRNCQVQHLNYQNGYSTVTVLVSSDKRSLNWIKDTIHNKVYDVKEKIRLTLKNV